MDLGAQQQRIPPHASELHATNPVVSPGTTSADSTAVKICRQSARSLVKEEEKDSFWVVVPEEAQEERWISLSVLDKFILPIYIPVYLIYDAISADCFDSFVDKVRHSLAKVLVPYYPWAGRLKKNPETQSWDLHCDNGGAEFRVVHVDEELRKTVFCRPCLQLRLLAPRLNAVPREDAPPVAALSVQVTRFRCGAVALGCSFHHQCGDAHAVSMFMQAWSQLTRGETLSQDPIHDRSAFVAATTGASVSSASTGSNPSAAPPAAIVGTKSCPSTPAPASDSGESSVEDDFGESCMEGLVYDKEALRELKAMAPPGTTSFEAVTAFVVRNVMKLDDSDAMAKFVLMVDFRACFDAATFAGNLALPKAVIMPRADFVDGPLANSVSPVHEAVKGADEAYFRAFVAYAGRGPPSKERAMAVSSCARMGLYDVEFGYGGPCFAGINPPVPRLVPQFLLFLPNASKGDGFVVYLQLDKALMNKLLQDPEFSSIGAKYEPLSMTIDNDEEEERVTTSSPQHSRI
ncbi:agmatine hydroxycinnamoyltransferase 1-like [Selaginella moellendorffii]|uniref:agmatine hydroxycinnamoyltransferase 1-like n=1 Tax=Selaginella moellendorffii TaxID=88036 RepID=UPI000D1C3A7F|nr:agmatine hydroxycinnamoyltransferase 1-like [Selaginella moellendorffii]XP_024519195.1 agmatine hydroxycinnamoyltransferase 1-like [Selaginella moellendorffii]|eukprot:XP_024519193.1 agmatine hydroxycinnamoyltransferase 1-like [Selaginella moellendorffii]